MSLLLLVGSEGSVGHEYNILAEISANTPKSFDSPTRPAGPSQRRGDSGCAARTWSRISAVGALLPTALMLIGRTFPKWTDAFKDLLEPQEDNQGANISTYKYRIASSGGADSSFVF